MMNFYQIKKITIPKNILNSTFVFLRKHGNQNLESHALWVGKIVRDAFTITEVWFPKHINTIISYEVPEDEIHRINVKLNELGLIALVQVHTHPTNAFHSNTDDEGSFLVLAGSYSLVIPDFGFIKEDDLEQWVLYQYDGKDWNKVSNKEVKELFQIQ